MPPQHKCAFVEGGQPKLSELTGLTALRATECLAENSNDLVTALASFVQNFKTLPADYFADANKAKTAAADINTMVGLAYDAVSAVMEAERLDEAEEGKCWKALATAKWDVKKACAALTASAAPVAATVAGASMENRYTGSFMNMPRFQQAEIDARATIFNMDKGFMASTNEAQLRERMLKWVEAVPAFRRVPLKYPPIPNYDENTVRVIVRDAERTFFDPEHRRKFHEFLHAMWKDLGTYGQAMSYLAAVCLLALTEEETSFVLRKVALDYIPGHWKNEADGFATNAWVIEHFFQEKFPDVAAHFKKFHFTPEMYMQKILSGLCVHVLPFKYMFQFLDNFLVKGFEYLVRFELAVVQHLKPKLLAINDPQKMHELFELMRLDINTIDLTDIEAILAGAANMQVDTSDVDVLRSRMYDEKVLPKLEAAKAAPPEFDPCSVCDKDEPTLFCDDCEIPICASCAKKAPHKDHSHSEY